MKMRSDCVLATLTPEQLSEIFDSLASGASYSEVQKRCAQEFGIRVHINTLCRFFKSERRRRHAEELAETRFNDLSADHPEQLLQNIKVELAHACYDLANLPDSNSVNALSRIIHRLDLIRLEQQRLALDREFLAEKKRQFNVNVAAEASIHAHEIKEVYKQKTGDLQQKLEQVTDIIFGPDPTQNNQ